MRCFFSLLALLAWVSASAQIEDPRIEIDHEATAGYRDSIGKHEGFGEILHYQPHLCQNRYGRYGWVDKYHKVIIPFEYLTLSSHLSEFNPAQKASRLHGAVDAKGKVIIPFQYTSVNPYYEQRLAVCRDGSYKITVFNFEGKVIIPEEKLYNIWLFSDTSLAVQDFSKKNIKIYDLQGRHIKTWAYAHILQTSSGRLPRYYPSPVEQTSGKSL